MPTPIVVLSPSRAHDTLYSLAAAWVATRQVADRVMAPGVAAPDEEGPIDGLGHSSQAREEEGTGSC